MKVSLRKRKIGDGRSSLRLDIYPPVVIAGKLARFESLGLYVYDSPRNPEERAHNKETIKLAETVRAQRQLDVQSDNFGLSHPGADLTLSDYIIKEAKKRREHTGKSWLYMLRHATLCGIESVTLDKVEVAVCNRLRDYFVRLVRDGQLSSQSAHTYFQHFRTAIRSAYQEGKIKTDYSTLTKHVKAISNQREYLDLEELVQLVNTPSPTSATRKICLFSALSSLRISDIESITWKDVRDNTDGTAVLYGYRVTKSGKKHILPLNFQARELMGKRGGGKVFPDVPPRSTLDFQIKKWVKAAGINKKISIHCLRHTYSVLILESGSEMGVLRDLLGHSSITTTEIYGHITSQSKRRAVDKVVLPVDLMAPPLRLIKGA